MERLIQVQQTVERRAAATAWGHGAWPCHKGCDDCCRSLASPPMVSEPEWALLAAAIHELPAGIRVVVHQRIRRSAGASRPVVCPLLEEETGACLVYAARPVLCRSYGFYVERGCVLGCGRIEAISGSGADVLWGNHEALSPALRALGEPAELAVWLDRDGESGSSIE